jgi:hypothetical protein
MRGSASESISCTQKVRMFLSNIPWKRPTAWAPFFRISQFCEAVPANAVNPSFS